MRGQMTNEFKIFISSAAAHQCAGLCSSTSAFCLSLVSQFILIWTPFFHGCVTHSMMFGIHWCKAVPLIAGCKSSFLDLGCLRRDCCEDIQWWIRQVIENLIMLKIKIYFILFLIWFNMHMWTVLSISWYLYTFFSSFLVLMQYICIHSTHHILW